MVHGNGMAGFVNGRGLQVPTRLDMAVLGRTRHDFHEGLIDILHRNHGTVVPGRHNGRLVEQIAQIRTGEAGSSPGHSTQVYGVIHLFVLGMDLEDLLTSLYIRAIHLDLPVKPAGTQQCRIQNVRPVGGCQNNNAFCVAEAVHLHQQLIQRLLLFVVAAAQAGAALAAHGIDLIDEDDGRSQPLGLIEEIPDTAGADTHVHLHKIRAGNGQKLYPGLSGYRPSQKRLAGARRAHQENAVGDAGTDLRKLLRIPKEIHDLLQLLLFLFGTGHIGKGDLLPVRHSQDSSGLAEVRQGIAAIHLAHEDAPQQQQHTSGQDDGQHNIIGREGLAWLEIIARQHAGGVLLLEQLLHLLTEALRLGQRCLNLRLSVVGSSKLQSNRVSLDGKGLDLLLLEQLHHLGIGDGVGLWHRQAADPAEHQYQGRHIYHQGDHSAVIQS